MTSLLTYVRNASIALAISVLAVAPLHAQKPSSPARAEHPAIAGTWSGTVSVPLGDSTITVPVNYTFTQTADGTGGTAIVPGQGMGTISNFMRTGDRVQFRVTVAPMQGPTPQPARLLEHDGKLGADGTLEGMVTLDNQPVAKFRISAKK